MSLDDYKYFIQQKWMNGNMDLIGIMREDKERVYGKIVYTKGDQLGMLWSNRKISIVRNFGKKYNLTKLPKREWL